MGKKEERKLIANNKKAYHDYFIDETYEAGVALHGTEVKSMRMGKCSIKESFVRIENGEVFVYGMHVSPYEKGNIFNKDPLRVKKLLLHRQEINKLAGKIQEKGYTLVPLQVYFKEGKVKVEIGLARGKKQGRDAEKTGIPEGRVTKDDVISIRTFPDAELFRIVIRAKHLPGGRPLNAGAAGTPIFAVVCMWHC